MRRSLLAVLAVLTFAAPGVRANPITQDACPGTATATIWKSGSDVLENLLVARDDTMWVSDSTSGAILHLDATGKQLDALKVPAPGAMSQASDGSIYANTGDSIGNAVQHTGGASVVRFSPAAPAATMTTVSSGFNMANGMWRDDASGVIYVSNDVDSGLVRIAPDGSWSLLNDTWGTNGLVVLGRELFAAITFDARSPIVATNLDTGARRTIALTAGAASLQPAVYPDGIDAAKPVVGVKGLDDMTTDGTYLYPVANGMGELLRVDPRSGASCLIAGGFQNTSSVRIAPESSAFADHDPATIDFYLTGFDGNIRRVVYAPA